MSEGGVTVSLIAFFVRMRKRELEKRGRTDMLLNGSIMSGNKVAATVVDRDITEYDEKLLPLYLLKTKDVIGWLESRAIDSHRTNSRLLKRALRLSNTDDLTTVLKVHAATITDNYWFKEQGSDLNYEEVRFRENYFDKLALYGDPDSFNRDYSSTPELTNIGSFEKCWRLIDGTWWLYKQGNDKEKFSELFISYLGAALGFDMAYYELAGPYIRSRDFTDHASVNFESAVGIVGNDEDYGRNYEALKRLSAKAAEQYAQMIYLDTVCFNMDRHTQNYGVLREVDTGKVLSLAPNFDNNIALISRGYPKVERHKDRLVEDFSDFRRQHPELVFPPVTREMIETCCNRIPLSVDQKFVVSFIMNGQERIFNDRETPELKLL